MTHSVGHNILYCSYHWHRSLKAESDHFLSCPLRSCGLEIEFLLCEYVAVCDVANEVRRRNAFVYAESGFRSAESVIRWLGMGKSTA